MNTIGLFRGMSLCKKYEQTSDTKREQIRQERFRQIVAFAKENSPYYANLYKNLPADAGESDYPPVNKQDLMKHWEEWCTDKNVTLREVEHFMENLDNIGSI